MISPLWMDVLTPNYTEQFNHLLIGQSGNLETGLKVFPIG